MRSVVRVGAIAGALGCLLAYPLALRAALVVVPGLLLLGLGTGLAMAKWLEWGWYGKQPKAGLRAGLIACIPVPGRTRRGEHLGTIPGMVPSLVGERTGCRFAGRCRYVIDSCRQADVPLERLGDQGRLVRCIRHDDLASLSAQAGEAIAS